MKYKRMVSKKVSVSDIKSGEYIKRQGFDPDVLLTKLGEVSRVHMVGVVVSELTNNTFDLDDGSGIITIRSFEDEPIKHVELGKLVK